MWAHYCDIDVLELRKMYMCKHKYINIHLYI